MASPIRQQRVAIVGSGMAGLTTAMLLNGDREGRYLVTVFESGDKLSLDAASVSIKDPVTGKMARVDVPMRAFAGGYYKNLRAMYDYLSVEYHSRQFLFYFSRASEPLSDDMHVPDEVPHFIHSSNNHHTLPIRPRGLPLLTYILEISYLLVWYMYFCLCCYLILPVAETGRTGCESFAQYVHRIRLPRYFVSDYLLPLMSSVATCSHEELLAFPASDVIDYKRRTSGEQHYVVSGGVRHVQRKLSKALDVRFGARVVAVQPAASGVRLLWRQKKTGNGVENLEELFDRVVLAVSPAVSGAIFEPIRDLMARIPNKEISSTVHTETIHENNRIRMDQRPGGSEAEIVWFRTLQGQIPRTESRHIQAFGNVITTCPLQPIKASCIIQESRFRRGLRTPESRKICNAIFGPSMTETSRWRNGDLGVWLAGGWCWDGMVLLEGCIVSAMRVAQDFDVVVPWRSSVS